MKNETLLICGCIAVIAMHWGAAMAQEETAPVMVRLIQPEDIKIDIPSDVILVPYDANGLPVGELPTINSLSAPQQRVFVSSDRYQELWNLVHKPKEPKKIDSPLLTAYALAGAEYSAKLITGTSPSALQEDLLIEGTIRFEIFTDEPLAVPFPVSGGVLESVMLNGKKAELGFSGELVDGGIDPSVRVGQNMGQGMMRQQGLYQAPESDMGKTAVYLLSVQGKGEYTLVWKTRYNIRRQGGWHIVSGRLPAVAATNVSLTIPEVGSELRTGNELDQRKWIAKQENEVFATTLSPSGAFHWQWRSQVTEGDVDYDLKVESDAKFEVREDGTRMTWNLNLAFGGGKHETFRLRLPANYQVAAIEGRNVRGWNPAEGNAPDADKQQIDVELLKPADANEFVTVVIWKNAYNTVIPAKAGIQTEGVQGNESVPVIEVIGSAMHRGRVTVMQSPLLNVRAVPESGVDRTDLPNASELARIATTKLAGSESPLGIKPVQAFRFSSESFRLNLDVSPIESIHHANIQSIVKMSEYETTMESNIILRLEKNPLYQADILLPKGLKVRRVNIPIRNEYIVHTVDEQLILSVYLPEGASNNVQMVVEGELPEKMNVALPKISVQNISGNRTERTFAILADPAFDINIADKVNISQNSSLTGLTWVSAEQRPLARLNLAVYYYDDYAAILSLVARQPDVTVSTISNTSVRQQSIEDTILVHYTIANAGIRRVEFELPNWLKDARIETPLLQRKTITPTDSENVLVRIDLQEEMMGDLQILVRSDRPLFEGTKYPVAIPVMKTGRVQRQFVVLENRQGIDEITSSPVGMRLLTRGQNDWTHLESILGANFGTGYIVDEKESGNASLQFSTHRRETLQMAGASIGLSETRLVVGETGSYVAEQVYHVDNKTEQYLDLRLPDGAELWVVRILTAAEWKQREGNRNLDLGEPVKPCQGEESSLRIPLVKSELGDPDYVLRLVYAGTLPPVRQFAQIEFPLIDVKKNIHVESSIVRLHLPKDFRYTFDGTLNLVEQQKAEQSVGQLKQNYEQNVVTRLKQSAQNFSNSFERSRAITNLGTLYDLNSEAIYPSGMLKNSNALITTGVNVLEQDDEIDNSANIERNYRLQNNVMARGNASQSASNWQDAPMRETNQPAPTKAKAFNDAWVESNQLSNNRNGQFEEMEPSQEGRDVSGPKQLSMSQQPQRQEPSPQQPSPPSDTSRVQQSDGSRVAVPPVSGLRSDGGTGRDSGAVFIPPLSLRNTEDPSQPMEAVYIPPQFQPTDPFTQENQNVSMGGTIGGGVYERGRGYQMAPGGQPAAVGQRGQGGPVPGAGALPVPVTSAPVPSSKPVPVPLNAVATPLPESPYSSGDELADRGFKIGQEGLGFDGFSAARKESQENKPEKNREDVMLSPLATRFASLDMDIPLDGQEYVFTSPRGEVELRARCYAENDFTRLWHLLASLLVIVAAIAVERFTRCKKRPG